MFKRSRTLSNLSRTLPILPVLPAVRAPLRCLQTASATPTSSLKFPRLTEIIDANLTTSLGDRDSRLTPQDDHSENNLHQENLHMAQKAAESLDSRSARLDIHIYRSNVAVRRLFDRYVASKVRLDPINAQEKLARDLLRNIAADVVARETVILPILEEAREFDGDYVAHDSAIDWKNQMQVYLDLVKNELSILENLEIRSSEYDEHLKRVVAYFEENISYLPDVNKAYPVQSLDAGTRFSEAKKLAWEQMREKCLSTAIRKTYD